MADEIPQEPTSPEEEYSRPDPKLNPRNVILGEIAKTVQERHVADAAETVDSIDDEGNITPAPPSAPTPEVAPPTAKPPVAAEPAPVAAPAAPATPPTDAIDPTALYEVTIDGQKMQVPGSKIIDAGFRTFQKETAADFRLKVASDLLLEAQRRAAGSPPPAAAGTPQPPAAQSGPSDGDLARALQFGTPEQAEAALAVLRGRGAVSPEQIQNFVAVQSRHVVKDELQFQEAVKFVQDEYGDLLKNDYLKRLFYVEEHRRRAAGDKRPYIELYKEVGNELRKAFNLPKAAAAGSPANGSTPGTPAARVERKAAAAGVPRTAASRLTESAADEKPKTASEIIAEMAARRGKTRLMQQPNRKE